MTVPAAVALIWLVLKEPPPRPECDEEESQAVIDAYRAGLVPLVSSGALLILAAIAWLSHVRTTERGIGVPTAVACTLFAAYVIACVINPDFLVVLMVVNVIAIVVFQDLGEPGSSDFALLALAAGCLLATIAVVAVVSKLSGRSRPMLESAHVACWFSLVVVIPTLLIPIALAGTGPWFC